MKKLSILFFGDVVARPGRETIKKLLPKLKALYKPDVIIANAENLAHIHGVTPKTLDELILAGVNFFTSGNDVFKKYTQFLEIAKNKKYSIVRPANFPADTPGLGERIIKIKNQRLLIINLMGQVFMKENVCSPFLKLDQILKKCSKKFDQAIIDFNAETTSESVALGWYADGRVAAVLGTHTHIPTADERILPQGTSYITDVGMTGNIDSVLGAKKEYVIDRYLSQVNRFHIEPEEVGQRALNAVYLELEDNKTKKIKRIQKLIKNYE